MSQEAEKDRLECRQRRARQGRPVRQKHANPTADSAYGKKTTAWKKGVEVALAERAEFYGYAGMTPEERAAEERERRKARIRCRRAWEREEALARKRIEIEKELAGLAQQALADLDEVADVGYLLAGIVAGTVQLSKPQREAAIALSKGAAAALRDVVARFEDRKVRLSSFFGEAESEG